MLFGNLIRSETSPALQEVEREMAPRLAAHWAAINLHAGLFARIDRLHARRDELPLDPEERRLLERVQLDFEREGARLPERARTRLVAVKERLAELTTRFSQNVLADEARLRLALRDARDLAGLPEDLLAAAREAGRAAGEGDVPVITLSRSLIVPFPTFSARRDLREQAFKAWIGRGENDGERDNRPVAREILALRSELARLHGFAHYADYALVDRMAATPAAVEGLLAQVWEPAKARAESEREALAAMAASLGDAHPIEPWDWRYYAEKVRKARFDFDEAQLKPYFSLERRLRAAFDTAHRLFGIDFVERPSVRAYRPDARAFEARGRDGRAIGMFLSDNFAKAPAGEPTLLSADDVRTLFHEFGHGLHGLLSQVTYERLSGVRVLRDFVELPSQIFEHWAFEPAVLRRHALHHETGEPISDEATVRPRRARQFNQGFETVEYAACAMLDMALHARPDADGVDISEFERAQLERIGMPREIVPRHRLPHFGHLFAGASYAAGYYVYLWAEVVGDGAPVAEAGDPFDASVAERLHRYVYSAGARLEPSAAYRAFRGRDPQVGPMLAKRGLVGEFKGDAAPQL